MAVGAGALSRACSNGGVAVAPEDHWAWVGQAYFPDFFAFFLAAFGRFFALLFGRTKLPGFCSFARFDPFFFAIVRLLAPADKESAAAE